MAAAIPCQRTSRGAHGSRHESAFPDAIRSQVCSMTRLLADWCLRYLGAPFDRVLFRSGFLSEVVGVEFCRAVSGQW